MRGDARSVNGPFFSCFPLLFVGMSIVVKVYHFFRTTLCSESVRLTVYHRSKCWKMGQTTTYTHGNKSLWAEFPDEVQGQSPWLGGKALYS